MNLSKSILSSIGYKNYLVSSLNRELTGQAISILDVGCGSSSPIRQIHFQSAHLVGIDQFRPALESSRLKNIHNKYVQIDALEIATYFGTRSFDYVIALDLLEHLEKEKGHLLIELMESVARKRIIIFTPNGYLPQSPIDENTAQEHLSGWTYKEMKSLGFRIYGINGWRRLRGERAEIRLQPKVFWKLLSRVTEPLFVNNPRYAFQLLCVKDLEI